MPLSLQNILQSLLIDFFFINDIIENILFLRRLFNMNKFFKYLLCIFFSILAINFVVSIIGFFKYNHSYLAQAQINANPTAESVVSVGKQLETNLETQITDLKSKNGNEYPALGILYYKAISHYSSVSIIQNFLFSLIAGFALGNIIFFIFISEFKTVKLAISLFLGLIVVCILLMLSDVYTAIANSEEIKFGLPEFFWNMELSGIVYLIVCMILSVIQKVYKTYHEIRYS